MTRLPILVLLLGACGGGDSALPDALVADAFVPDATFVCSLTEQDCFDDEQKCTLVDNSLIPGNERGCVPITGNVTEGDACDRDPVLGFGNDDCAPGLTCTFIGVLPPNNGGSRRCRTLCYTDDDCPSAAQRCAKLDDYTPPGGFCGPTCAPFSICSDGMTCGDLYTNTSGDVDLFLTCRVIGAVALGETCPDHYACGPDAVCSPFTATCIALCDDTHPCAAGTCNALGGLSFCN